MIARQLTTLLSLNSNCWQTSAAALVRAIGPSAGGSLFSWSESNGLPFPLNYRMVWVVIGVFMLIAWAVSCSMPRSTDKRRVDPGAEPPHMVEV